MDKKKVGAIGKDLESIGDNKFSFKDIPGLLYIKDFISLEEEELLIKGINDNEWNLDLKRRVQQYGYTFNHESQHVKLSTPTPAMPIWMDFLRERLVDFGFFDIVPDQLIVNEYEVGQGIHAHIDKTHCFGDVVTSISLLSSCNIVFTHPDTKVRKELFMERRSIVVLRNDARFIWKHGIDCNSDDKYDGILFKRKKRVSLTFRLMIQEYLDKQRKGNTIKITNTDTNNNNNNNDNNNNNNNNNNT